MKSYFYYTRESVENFNTLRKLEMRGQEDKILTEEEKEEQGKTELYNNCVIYESQNSVGVIGYPILEGDTVRNATLVELIDLGEQKLLAGEVINREAGTIEIVPQPSWQYKWDYENLKWIVNEDTIQDGQYVEGENIIDVPYSEELGYLIPHWNKESHEWEEGATEEQKAEEHKYLINTYKAKTLEQGFNYNEHQQKCRDKDLALLGNAIAANEDMATYSKSLNTVWSFNDGDILEMSLDELKRLRLMGAVFVQAIFTVEAQLKVGEVNIHLTGKEFIEKVNEISDVKCYFDDIKETEIPSSYKVGGGTNLSNFTGYSQKVNSKLRNVNARATTISLNSIDERVRQLEGTTRTTPIDMKSLDDRISELENSGKKEIYVCRLNARKVNASGAWASEKLSEIPNEWQMEQCYVCAISANGGGGLYAVLNKGESWTGGFTSGTAAGDNYNTGIRRTSTQFEIYKGDVNNGITGYIVFTK